MEPGSFQWCPARGSEAMRTNSRFPLNIRKHFYTVSMTEHWYRLPREIVESLFSETLKNHLGIVLGNLL